MININSYKSCAVWILLIPIIYLFSGCAKSDKQTDVSSLGKPADIEPDYSGTVIPPNIAPLNFVIKTPAKNISYKFIPTKEIQ